MISPTLCQFVYLFASCLSENALLPTTVGAWVRLA